MGMAYMVAVRASSWAGLAVPCHFTAKADGKALATDDDTEPYYDIPPNTAELEVTATPQGTVYWPTTVTISISSSNDFTAEAGSEAFVLLKPVGGASLAVVLANIKVSRFKEVTSDVVDLLKHPPSKRHIKNQTTGKWSMQNVTVEQTVKEHENAYGKGSWPPKSWDLNPVPKAHFLDVNEPVRSGALNFAQDPSLTLDSESIVLQLAGVDAPQLFAVLWPKALVPKTDAKPTPFFMFIRQGNSGNKYDEDGEFIGGDLAPYPNNFDYADIGLFESVHYDEWGPLWNPGPKGVAYQVAKSGANVVTVIPCNSFEKEYGVLNQTEETGKILLELQAFMFWRAGVQTPPASVGRTAIAAFSSANYFLNNWLNDKAKGSFLANTLSAVYFLDPPTSKLNGFIKSALTWASGSSDKRIRLYSRAATDAHKSLLGSTPPAAPYIKNSGDTRTAGVIPLSAWLRAKSAFELDNKWDDWSYAHHIIAATVLTHALAQGDF